MILEGLISTLNADGTPHVAPMGPRVDGPTFDRFLLRPFPTSHTYRNLARRPEGVLHVTDDVLLIAKASVGKLIDFPPHRAAEQVRGVVLTDACRYFEFRVERLDDSEERVRLDAVVVHSGNPREFFGFNRAKHAVLEAAPSLRSQGYARARIDARIAAITPEVLELRRQGIRDPDVERR